jgi:hypothetical protein
MSTPNRACIVTTISRSYVPFAVVLVDSIREHHPELDVLVCIVDDAVEHVPDCCIGVSVQELLVDRGLEDMLTRYTRQPLVVAAKAPMLELALRRGYERAVFLDVDMLVTGPLSHLLALDAADILLTPHMLTPTCPETSTPAATAEWRELNIIRCGVFNGGCLSVGAGPNADAFLEWFTARLRTHCLHDVEHGLHYDQTWLDLVPGMFDGVGVLRDPGCNVAYWNLPERPVRALVDGNWSAAGAPLSLFHFSGFDPRRPEQPSKYRPDLAMSDMAEAAPLFADFHERLVAAGILDTIDLPSGLATASGDA